MQLMMVVVVHARRGSAVGQL